MRERLIKVLVIFAIGAVVVLVPTGVWIIVNSFVPIGPSTGGFGGLITALIIIGSLLVESATCYVIWGDWLPI